MSLRSESAIYAGGDGRINIAGLPAERTADFAAAITEVPRRRRWAPLY